MCHCVCVVFPTARSQRRTGAYAKCFAFFHTVQEECGSVCFLFLLWEVWRGDGGGGGGSGKGRRRRSSSNKPCGRARARRSHETVTNHWGEALYPKPQPAPLVGVCHGAPILAVRGCGRLVPGFPAMRSTWRLSLSARRGPCFANGEVCKPSKKCSSKQNRRGKRVTFITLRDQTTWNLCPTFFAVVSGLSAWYACMHGGLGADRSVFWVEMEKGGRCCVLSGYGGS